MNISTEVNKIGKVDFFPTPYGQYCSTRAGSCFPQSLILLIYEMSQEKYFTGLVACGIKKYAVDIQNVYLSVRGLT